jgi:hypothetical protein
VTAAAVDAEEFCDFEHRAAEAWAGSSVLDCPGKTASARQMSRKIGARLAPAIALTIAVDEGPQD